ncbi:MAG: DUF167 domain-containing protein [Myxococcales bacterium]|nr:DUF167 domain-containing protein [Myxococcales bacterium]
MLRAHVAPAAVRASKSGGTLIAVRAKPRASRSAILGLVTDPNGAVALDVAIAAPPSTARPTPRSWPSLAGVLGLPKRSVRIARGDGSRHKMVEVDAPTEAVLACLADLV